MGRTVIINGSPVRTGYWANEKTSKNAFGLLTHRHAALELAVAWQQKDGLCWYPTAMAMGFFGPLVLESWQRSEGFFKLHFKGIERPTKVTRTNAQSRNVLRELKHGQDLVFCDDVGVSSINMETRRNHPGASEVEDALRAAGVPLV